MLTSDDQKRAFCETVLSVFPEMPKLERKAQLAKTCTPLGLKNVIVDGEYKNLLTKNDLEIIGRFTGKIYGEGMFGRAPEK